jgi:NADP-dependent 3-hydroxy acid dehydrogenase YdfG
MFVKRFENKTVMVTGAGANIGKEIALSFAREGANVIVCDYKKENAERTAEEIKSLGVSAMTAVCDVRDREKIFDFVSDAIKRFGKIDVLVNNAGGSAGLLGKLSKFVDAEPSTLDFVIDTNIKGAMNCTQAVLKNMMENNGGHIINMASIAGITGLVDRVDYSASKAALRIAVRQSPTRTAYAKALLAVSPFYES